MAGHGVDDGNGDGNGDGDDDGDDGSVGSRSEVDEEVHSDILLLSDLELSLKDKAKGYSILMIKPQTASRRLLWLKQTLRDHGIRAIKEKVETMHYGELERALSVEYDNQAVIGQFASNFAGKAITVWLLSLQRPPPWSWSESEGEDIYSVLSTLVGGMLNEVFFVSSSAASFWAISDSLFLDFGGDTPPETPLIGLKLKSMEQYSRDHHDELLRNREMLHRRRLTDVHSLTMEYALMIIKGHLTSNQLSHDQVRRRLEVENECISTKTRNARN